MSTANAGSQGRRLELDAVRGLMLVWMALTHLPTRLPSYVNQPFGFFAATEYRSTLARQTRPEERSSTRQHSADQQQGKEIWDAMPCVDSALRRSI